MTKKCPDCGWPYVDSDEYTRHLINGICQIYQKEPYLNIFQMEEPRYDEYES